MVPFERIFNPSFDAKGAELGTDYVKETVGG